MNWLIILLILSSVYRLSQGQAICYEVVNLVVLGFSGQFFCCSFYRLPRAFLCYIYTFENLEIVKIILHPFPSFSILCKNNPVSNFSEWPLTLLYSTCNFSCSLCSLSFMFFCSVMLSWIWIIRMFRSEYQWEPKSIARSQSGPIYRGKKAHMRECTDGR